MYICRLVGGRLDAVDVPFIYMYICRLVGGRLDAVDVLWPPPSEGKTDRYFIFEYLS